MSIAIEIDLWLQEHAKQAEPVLILAARQGRIDVLNHILNQGVDLKVLDLYGNNALWAACFAESSECIKRLLDAGIEINYQNTTGNVFSSKTPKNELSNPPHFYSFSFLKTPQLIKSFLIEAW